MNYLQAVKDTDLWLSKGETPNTILHKNLVPGLSLNLILFIADEIKTIEKPAFISLYTTEIIGVLLIGLVTVVCYAFNIDIISITRGCSLISCFLILRYFIGKNAREKVRQEFLIIRHEQMELIAAKVALLANK